MDSGKWVTLGRSLAGGAFNIDLKRPKTSHYVRGAYEVAFVLILSTLQCKRCLTSWLLLVKTVAFVLIKSTWQYK